MTNLDLYLAGYNQQVTPNEDHQSAHYASPTTASPTAGNTKTVFFALLGMVAVIYLLHVAERAVG